MAMMGYLINHLAPDVAFRIDTKKISLFVIQEELIKTFLRKFEFLKSEYN
jgi:hypothetical protein